MSLNGAEQMLANADSLDAKVVVNGQTLLTGELDSADFDYEGRSINVHGRCKSAALHAVKSSEKWLNKKPNEIIEDLAKRAGLQADIATEALKAGRKWGDDWVKLTDGVSYASAIHKLCDFMGARWWVDADGKLNVKGEDDSAGTYTISYQEPSGGPARSDALSIRIHRNYQAGKNIEVLVKSWNQKEKKVYESKKKVGGGVGGDAKFEYHIAGLTQEHADKHAKSKAKEHARHELQLTARCAGDPSCVAGMKLTLRGDIPFAQDFDIDDVRHQFGMHGYTMTISARSAKSGRSVE